MLQLDLRTLIGKLNGTTRNALEAATGLCLSRTHYDVEIEHWLVKLVEPSDTDIEAIFQHYDVDLARLPTIQKTTSVTAHESAKYCIMVVPALNR